MKVLDVGKIFETNYIICILGKPKKRYYFIDTMRGKNKIETIKKIYCSAITSVSVIETIDICNFFYM